MLKCISWNVNGIRAALKKDFMQAFTALDADFFCLQETKAQQDQVALALPGYHQFWCDAVRKGYSGTAIFTRHKPIAAQYGMGLAQHDTEGRLITLEYEKYFFATVYTPNSQDGLRRLPYRMEWEEDFRAYMQTLSRQKPVIFCGDLNVAHQEIDLKNFKTNRNNPGFTDAERHKFSLLLDAGFTDTFRHFYPDATGAYSWWSYRANARANNAGWRIDYFITSQALDGLLLDAKIHSDVFGSDHCPVELTVDL